MNNKTKQGVGVVCYAAFALCYRRRQTTTTTDASEQNNTAALHYV